MNYQKQILKYDINTKSDGCKIQEYSRLNSKFSQYFYLVRHLHV